MVGGIVLGGLLETSKRLLEPFTCTPLRQVPASPNPVIGTGNFQGVADPRAILDPSTVFFERFPNLADRGGYGVP